jgi:hypothetical protein
MSKRSIVNEFLVVLFIVALLINSGCSIGRERAKDREGDVDKEMSLEEKFTLQRERSGVTLSGVEKAGIFFHLGGTDTIAIQEPSAALWPEAVHTCEEEDELRIEKIEIVKEDGKVVLTVEIPEKYRPLAAVGQEFKELKALEERLVELWRKLKQMPKGEDVKSTEEMAKEYSEGVEKLSILRNRVRKKSFRSRENPLVSLDNEIFYIEVDLRDFKKDLKQWDIIPIIGRAYFKHRWESIVLEDTFFVRYTGLWRSELKRKPSKTKGKD